ncbi:MAG: DUF3078 domain-containing protein [Bacteroidales bacterium]|nr:DUF3078 domain-containing protein [Bacteroidales bacterium]
MKKFISIIALFATLVASAQTNNTQDIIAAAAAALSAAEDVPVKEEKPRYWTNTFLTNISFGQTYLSQWAAGGYSNISLAGNVDASANYAKDKLLGTNRLQLDYGFLYSADKPIAQKNKDRIYLESKWGYETPVKNLAYSASFDFKTQFGNNYNYKSPSDAQFAKYPDNPSAAWREAAKDNLKSGFFAPAYINMGVGVLWTPAPWFSLNVAPLSGGGVIVSIPELRKTYGMDLVEGTEDQYKSWRLEFGTQIKADMAWVINDVFSYSTQLTLFYNYLTPKVEPRVTWDNKIIWKLAKYFAVTVSTNLIYDPKVLVRDINGDGKVDTKGIQFKEFLEFGFTYTLTNKK